MQFRLVTYLCILFFSAKSFGQLSDVYPAYFQDYYINPSIGNPAIFSDKQGHEFLFQYKSYFGPLSEIKILNGSLSTLIKKKNKLGLRFQTEQEGDFFQKNRVNLIYGVKIDFSSKWSANLGAYIGGVSYSFSPSSLDPGGGDLDLDLGFGVSVYSGQTVLAVSSNQINSPVIQPIIDTYSLSRYSEFFVKHEFKLSPNYLFIPQLKYRYTQNKDERIFQTTALFKYEPKDVFLGVHYLHDLGVSPTVGMRLPYNEIGLGVFFSAFFSVNQLTTVFIQNQFELTLKFDIKKKTKNTLGLN